MAEFLLELYSEEIPARMQENGASEICQKICAKLDEAKIGYKNPSYLFTPQRIAIAIEDIETHQQDQEIEKRGPKIGAPEQALLGFCKSVGVTDASELSEEDGYYYFRSSQKGGNTADSLPTLLQDVITNYTWPKSMRWNDYDFRWVRPLHSIICLFGGKILPFEIAHIKSSNKTKGHRFLSNKSLNIENFTDYTKQLKENSVILDQKERKELILKNAHEIAKKNNYKLIEDDALLNELVGLNEYPVILGGKIDDAFLSVPKEALISSMKSHQKYFACENSDGTLAPLFIFVSNIKTASNNKEVIEGNQRVLRARLSDAKFFFEQDKKIKLDELAKKLELVTFHEKIGSIADKVARIKNISVKLAKDVLNIDTELAQRAASLCKADLVSGMVEEFPELQGIMGRYYALEQKENSKIADAIRDHYLPKGANDDVPTEKLSIAIALADRIDNLNEMFAAGQKPTGSKDPFGLRRAALGIIRIVTENRLYFDISDYITNKEAQEFIIERMKHYLKSSGYRHDVIDAVLNDNNLSRMKATVEALQKFTEDKGNEALLLSYKRCLNILDDGDYTIDEKLLEQKEEKGFAIELERANSGIIGAQKDFPLDPESWFEDFSSLRDKTEEFFDNVMINAEDKKIRDNRMGLAQKLVKVMNQIADFSKIQI